MKPGETPAFFISGYPIFDFSACIGCFSSDSVKFSKNRDSTAPRFQNSTPAFAHFDPPAQDDADREAVRAPFDDNWS